MEAGLLPIRFGGVVDVRVFFCVGVLGVSFTLLLLGPHTLVRSPPLLTVVASTGGGPLLGSALTVSWQLVVMIMWPGACPL